MRTRVGIVGSGYISRGLTAAIEASPDMKVSRVLTRTPPGSRGDFPRAELLTTSLNELVDNSDVVVQSTMRQTTALYEELTKAIDKHGTSAGNRVDSSPAL